LPAPKGLGDRVVLRFLPGGHSGVATIGNALINVCLVSTSRGMPSVKTWAQNEFGAAPDQSWRSMAPLARRAIAGSDCRLHFIGDAARVVEPFTGEGIYYALASGELAARDILRGPSEDTFAREHAALYRDRLWINQLAKFAVLHPRFGSLALDLARFHPCTLRFLTRKVMGATLR